MLANFDELLQNFEGDIEYQYSCRVEEFRKCENCINLTNDSESNKDIYRKMLVVMMYSYFEGFCKNVLMLYAHYISSLELKVGEVTSGLAATSLEKDFNMLENSNHKPIELKGELIENDGRLHRFSRRKEFVENNNLHINKTVNIPNETIDVEDNLKSYVLKSLLYKLDIDYTIVDPYQGILNELLGKRNAIAHGDMVNGIELIKYNDYKSKILQLMDAVKTAVLEAFKNETFLNASNNSTTGAIR